MLQTSGQLVVSFCLLLQALDQLWNTSKPLFSDIFALDYLIFLQQSNADAINLRHSFIIFSWTVEREDYLDFNCAGSMLSLENLDNLESRPFLREVRENLE